MSEKTKQREVKFRGQTITGEWNYGYVVFTADRAFILLDIGGLNYEVIPETVGQFTGLLDKNGKEIYEGDILKSSNAITGHVTFSNGSFLWQDEPIGYDESTDNPFPPQNWATIIGNIYETPNLLQTQSR